MKYTITIKDGHHRVDMTEAMKPTMQETLNEMVIQSQKSLSDMAASIQSLFEVGGKR